MDFQLIKVVLFNSCSVQGSFWMNPIWHFYLAQDHKGREEVIKNCFYNLISFLLYTFKINGALNFIYHTRFYKFLQTFMLYFLAPSLVWCSSAKNRREEQRFYNVFTSISDRVTEHHEGAPWVYWINPVLTIPLSVTAYQDVFAGGAWDQSIWTFLCWKKSDQPLGA